jgi:hypothetical protein
MRSTLWRAWLAGRVVLLVAGALAGVGCASDFAVLTSRDPTVKFAAGATYAFRVIPQAEKQPGELDPRVNNAALHDRIRKAIEAVLAEKGFRPADAKTADFLVEFHVGLKGTMGQAAQFNAGFEGAPVGQDSSAYTGGKYGPQPVTTITTETTQAEISVTLVERATGRAGYRAMGVDEDVMRGDGSEQAISMMVTALLRGLP